MVGLPCHRFRLSYQILDNKVTQTQERRTEEICDFITRRVEIELSVIDTYSNQEVWGGIVDQSLTDSACNSRSESTSESVSDLMIESVFDAAFRNRAEAPKLTTATKKIFDVYEDSLP